MAKEQVYIAACYCRLSQDDDRIGTSVSIETQKNLLEDYCREKGIHIFDFYCDDGWTGTNFERPEFKRMMGDVRNGNVNTVIVKDLSRFGRNATGVDIFFDEIVINHEARFISIGDGVDTLEKNDTFYFYFPMMNVVNQLYPYQCGEKTRQAIKNKQKRGEYIGSQAPYGYKKSPQDKHKLIIDEECAPTVKWIFEQLAYHGMGFNKIAKILSAKKIITPSALQAERAGREYTKDPYHWNLATLQSMVNNRAYLGTLVSGTRVKVSYKSKKIKKVSEDEWIVHENMHEALIPRELWDATHEKVTSRKRECIGGIPNIFSGLLKCEDCGYALGRSNSTKRDAYYICNVYKKDGKDKCTSHYIRLDELYPHVLEDIKRLLLTYNLDKERFAKEIKNHLKGTETSRYQAIVEEIEELKANIELCLNKLDTMYMDRLDGKISVDVLSIMSKRIEEEKRKAEERINILENEIKDERNSEVSALNFVNLLDRFDTIEELDTEILNRLIEKITVGERTEDEDGNIHQTITIYYRFLGECVF